MAFGTEVCIEESALIICMLVIARSFLLLRPNVTR